MSVRILTATVSVLLIISVTGNPSHVLAGTPDYKQEFEKELDFSPGGSLTICNICGQIEISGWEEDLIEIYALKTVSGELAPEAARELMAQVAVEVARKGNSVEVKTKDKNHCGTEIRAGNVPLPSCEVEVSYWIKVPRNTDIQLRSLDSYVMLENLEGDIELSMVSGSMFLQDLDGELEVNLVNGPILAENVRGELRTNTISGSTQVRFQDTKSARLNTTNGKITLELPVTAAVDLEASTLTGELKIDPRLKAETFSNKRNFESKINGGGPPVKIHSLRGPILISIY